MVPIFAHANINASCPVNAQSPPKCSVFAFPDLFIQALIYPELILFCPRRSAEPCGREECVNILRCQRAPRHRRGSENPDEENRRCFNNLDDFETEQETNKKEVTTHEKIHNPAGTRSGNQFKNHREVLPLSRGPRPQRALSEAIPIAQLRGVVQLAGISPERIYDISIVSKIPVTFARVMFAPQILVAIEQIAGDFKDEIAQLRLIARDAAISAELWLRSKHGTWRFFLVTGTGLIEIDRDGKPLVAGGMSA
jgi:hypothetical protein